MDPVSVYEVEMEPSDYKWWKRHVGTERYFPAELRIGDQRWPLFIGYRGRFSRFCPKPSYELVFESAAFGGHGRLHLNAAYYDPSLLRCRLAFDLFASLGVPAPETKHIWLLMNGHPMGLYTAVEAIDGHWLARRGEAGGAVYYGVGSGGTFGLIDRRTGKPKRHLAQGYEKCYPADDDFSELEQLLLQITLPTDEAFEAEIASVLDLQAVLRWLAGVVFISHTDGLVQNYALIRGADGRWQISPWDCDGTWGRCPDGSRLPADYVGLSGDGGNYLAARLLLAPRWRTCYLDLWEELLDTHFRPEAITDRLATIYGEIRTLALSDRMKRLGNGTFLREPNRIRHYARERAAFLAKSLAHWRATPGLLSAVGVGQSR